MVSMAKWEPSASFDYHNSIIFWARIIKLQEGLKTKEVIRFIGESFGVVHAVDAPIGRFKVELPCDKPLIFESDIEIREGEVITITVDYERLMGVCPKCLRMNHHEEICKPVIDIGKEMANIRFEASKNANHVKSSKGAVQTGATGSHSQNQFRRPERRQGRTVPNSRAPSRAPQGSNRPAHIPVLLPANLGGSHLSDPFPLDLGSMGAKKAKQDMLVSHAKGSASNFKENRPLMLADIAVAGQKAASLIEEAAFGESSTIPELSLIFEQELAEVEPFTSSQLEDFNRDIEMQEVAALKPPRIPSKITPKTTPIRGVSYRKLKNFELLSPKRKTPTKVKGGPKSGGVSPTI